MYNGSQKYLRWWQQSFFRMHSSPPKWPPNNLHTLGCRKFLIHKCLVMMHDRKIVAGIMSRDSSVQRLILWWRFLCALILFLLLVVGDWNRDISGNMSTTLMCGVILLGACYDVSYVGTNEWTVNVTFSPEIRTNCSWIAVNSVLGCFCGDATHS